MPTAIDDRISASGNSPARDHIADRVLLSIAERANAFITMMAFGNDSGANQIIQLLQVSSRG